MLFVLCAIFMWCIQARIDEHEVKEGFGIFNHVSSLLQVRSNRYETEKALEELKGETDFALLCWTL